MDEKAPEQPSKRGKRWRIIVMLGALVAGVAIVAFWPGEKEPEYKGKKLSEWVAVYNDQPAELSEAMQAMGKRANGYLKVWHK
jgi:hypothetical protein